MAKTIWKFTLQPECTIEMPEGATLLSVREQDGAICLWAMVDPSAPIITRSFICLKTGHSVPDHNLNFVGTAMLYGGSWVFHIFEKV